MKAKYSIRLQSVDSFNESHINEKDFETMFGGLTFDDFQTKLIGIVTKEKMHAIVENYRGNEVMTMRYSPTCEECICCMWNNQSRLNRFIRSFAA